MAQDPPTTSPYRSEAEQTEPGSPWTLLRLEELGAERVLQVPGGVVLRTMVVTRLPTRDGSGDLGVPGVSMTSVFIPGASLEEFISLYESQRRPVPGTKDPS